MATTIAVGMSGGVDSSVTALLLKQKGYRVIGLFMKNWDDGPDSLCPAEADYEDVVRVCEAIDIPYYSVNFTKEYWDSVFSYFLQRLELGLTPNPDVLCNREIKFKALLNKALELGADALATGHYARIAGEQGHRQLLKAIDPSKDQSYFLYLLNQKALNKALFPIGELHKSEVRELAEKYHLATARKRDSTGICFIGKRDFKEFMSRYLPLQKGPLEDLEGHVLGEHDGAAFYTIGQRRGLGIGGAGEPWFVVGKDLSRNVVLLAQGSDHPALFCDDLTAGELHWISPEGPPALPFKCQAKVRYRQADQICTIEAIENGIAHVTFDQPQRAVTPDQAIVFYHGELCLGGGTILQPGRSYYKR